MGQKKEELHLLQNHTELKKADLREVLRDGEMEAAERRQEIKVIHPSSWDTNGESL